MPSMAPAVTPLPDEQVQRMLAVAAHPDDLDFGASGTLAACVANGVEVTYLLCTYGDQGGFDSTPREQIPALREQEQRAAAKAIGVQDVRFLQGYRDGWLEPTFDLQKDIVRVIREVQPQRLLTQSPERWWDRIPASHPDHLAAGEATVRAVYPAAQNPFAWPELLEQEKLEPWPVSELWLMAHHSPNHFVDITETLPRKLAALEAHVSQTAHLGEELATRITQWGTRVAAVAGLPEGRLAEAFRVCPLN